jgi:phosphoribosyl-AMP cyclohydrolase
MNQEIDFEKMRGLAPAIVQDAAGGDVLMLGFMNPAALERTLSTGYVTFFSRTRNLLWTKGETSGNRLRVVTASTDCDHDSLLFKVEVEGEGKVCHEGTKSCFTKPIVRAELQPTSALPEAAL